MSLNTKRFEEITIRVECYSGYKADESPRYFYLNNIRFEIKKINDRWHQADPDPGFPLADYFKVSTKDNKQYILKHYHQSDSWYLCIKGESINLFS